MEDRITFNLKGNTKILLNKSDGKRIIAGYANVAIIDLENQYIPLAVLQKGIQSLLADSSYANLMIMHKNIQIGKIIPSYGKYKTGVDSKGLYIVCEVRKDIKVADEIWGSILKKEISGFSIGCEVILSHKVCDNKECVTVLDKINIFEVSVCLPPNQLIQCNPREKEIKDIEVGDKVLTHLGNYKKVIKKYTRDYKGKMFHIKPRFTMDIFSLTPNHPVLSSKFIKCKSFDSWKDINCNPNCKNSRCNIKPKEFKKDWVRADELTEKDYLVYPINKTILTNKEILEMWDNNWISIRNNKNGGLKKEQLLNKDFWRLVGYWLAEGSLSQYKNQRQIIFYLGKHETKIIKDISKLIKETTNRKPYISSKYNNVTKIEFSDKSLYMFLKQFRNVPYKVGQKIVPIWVEKLSLESQRELLIGYYLGDNFISVSKQLLKSIQRILLRFNILIPMFEDNKRKSGFIDGRLCNFQTSYSLGDEKSSLRKLLDLPLIHSKKEGHLEKWDENNVYVPIESISTTDYVGQVMNLEVSDDNSYGNSLLMTHNCTEPVNQKSGFTVISKSEYEKFRGNIDMLNVNNISKENMVEEIKKDAVPCTDCVEPIELSIEERLESLEKKMIEFFEAAKKKPEEEKVPPTPCKDEKKAEELAKPPVPPFPPVEQPPGEQPVNPEEKPPEKPAWSDEEDMAMFMLDYIIKNPKSTGQDVAKAWMKMKQKTREIQNAIPVPVPTQEPLMESLMKKVDTLSEKLSKLDYTEELKSSLKVRDDAIQALEKKIEIITKSKEPEKKVEPVPEVKQEIKTVQSNTEPVMEIEPAIRVSNGTVTSSEFM
jgi:hypothetical protein